jgi:hypothetical protein
VKYIRQQALLLISKRRMSKLFNGLEDFKGTKDLGMIYILNLENGLEVYVHASFAGNWNNEHAEWDADNAR